MATVPPHRKALYPGTFDPVTTGHMDVLHEASRIFDQVVAAVGPNPDKVPLFTQEERFQMLSEAVCEEGFSNVTVTTYQNLTVEVAREHGAGYILRGLRAVTDFEAEMMLLLSNEQLDSAIKTVFLIPSLRHLYLSSSLVRQAARYGRRIVPDSVPPVVERKLREKFEFPPA